MKIGFVGLRGFTKDSNLIDLNGITLLTGKNSSGKSSFLKLFRLLFSSFSKIRTLDDLFDIEVDIASDEFGGKEKIASVIIENNPKIVFNLKFEFFRGVHEIHIGLDILDYVIKVSQIEFYDRNSIKQNKPFGIWKNKTIAFNLFELRKLYIENVSIYNLCEEYRFALSEKDHIPILLDEILKNFELKELDSILEDHIGPYDDDAILWNHEDYDTSDFNNTPFREVNRKQGYTTEKILFEEDIASFQFTRQDYDAILNAGEFKVDFLNFIELQKNGNQKFDGFKFIKKVYEILLTKYTVSTSNFEWSTIPGSINLWRERETQESIDEFLNEHYSESFLRLMIYSLTHYFNPLVKITSHILQASAVRQIRHFGEFKSLSNIRYQPTRSFNIYNQSNTFSNFIKNWKITDKKTQIKRISFLKRYLVDLEIADDIKIILQDNIGFIHLIKNKQTFAVIDEGSGVSNVLSVALCLSEAIVLDPDDNSILVNKPNTKYIILEEPESNLHPSLQSKLANLISEIYSLTNVNLIIESHSEYLIRKLQYLVATKKVDQSKISINYFSMALQKKQQYIQTKLINIESNGSLTDEFGPGFYDEANNLSIDLFLLTNSQNN